MATEASHNPLHQFQIEPIVPLHLGKVDVSFTNSALFMVIAIVLVTLFLVLATARAAMVPGRWQAAAESFYEFIHGMVLDNVGEEGRSYFPFVFTLFSFVLFGNVLGLIPYGFTFTSHIIVTFGLSLLVFALVVLVALFRHQGGFFTQFLPKGTPIFIAPVLVPIEIISFLSRPVSLSVRLFANMLAGHMILFVIAGFVVSLGGFGIIPGVVPLAVNVGLYLLEILVCLLQAYVFTILTCIYLGEAVHMHH